VLTALEANQGFTPNLDRLCQAGFHDALILFHRAKGVALGPLADTLIETYWSVSQEAIGKAINKTEARSLIERKINGLVAFYSFAHLSHIIGNRIAFSVALGKSQESDCHPGTVKGEANSKRNRQHRTRRSRRCLTARLNADAMRTKIGIL